MDQRHPFSLIEMHPAELAANKGKWDELLESYVVHSIGTNFHCSFEEWVKQPYDMVQKQISLALRLKEEELRKINNVNNSSQQVSKEIKKVVNKNG